MGCGQCSSGGCGAVRAIAQTEKTNHKTVSGCSSGGCSSGSCNKMNTFDWLSDMAIPAAMRFDVVEVKFKGGRKEYFRNTGGLELYTGDFVVCEMASGYHIGSVSLQGELVRLQMIKKGIKENDDIKKILRVCSEKDLEKHQQAVARDIPTMYRVRVIAKELKLQMKISDVEFQSDNTKATFYYSADDRVDFREMIKILASEFKIRVEMKQISLRQEAARVGGIGSCGRELCCSTWLTDFRAIPTSAARYQNLSLNPAKLSGQCGRLKCCLNYELETYLDALNDIPTVEKPLKTEKGIAVLQKTDIFRRIMWFSYNNDINWHSLPIPQVVKIMEMNEKGILPTSLEDLNIVEVTPLEKNAPKNSDLDRLDKKYTDKHKKHISHPNKKNPNQKTGKPVIEDRNIAPKPQVPTHKNNNQSGQIQKTQDNSNQNNPPKHNHPNRPIHSEQKQGGGQKNHPQQKNQGQGEQNKVVNQPKQQTNTPPNKNNVQGNSQGNPANQKQGGGNNAHKKHQSFKKGNNNPSQQKNNDGSNPQNRQ